MIVAANAVLPIAAFMFLGAFLKAKGKVKDSSFKDFNWVVFNICLPITLFNSIQNMDPSQLTNPGIVFFSVVGIFAVILISVLVVSRFNLDDTKKGVIVQAIFRSNFVILGLPIVQSIYGAENTGVTSLMIAFVVPVFNIVSVIILERYSGSKASLSKTIINIFKNPLIIGTIVGFVYKFLPFTAPTIILSFIKQVGNMSTPLSLFVLGGSFEFISIKNNLKILIGVTIARLVLVPLIVITIAVLVGYRGVELASILVLFGGPVAIASFSMALQMGLDGELAAQCVMVTMISVIFTMFVFISSLGSLGLL